MLEIKEKHRCCGCGACQSICPKHCITLSEDEEGFLYPTINQQACIKCGLCQKVCPILKPKPQIFKEPKAFASIHNNQEIRLQSSSGGVFTALTEYVLKSGGVVFGAGFDENFMVCHQFVEDIDSLRKLRTSKYVQSKIGNSYQTAKKFLEENRLVYFSGTPCQVAGLKSFLIKDYDNLITQDVICHGVPSPLVWKKYLNHKTQNLKLTNVCFRDKKFGWRKYHISITAKTPQNQEVVYSKPFNNEPYMNMFIFNKVLRPSCHKCSFKGAGHQADITLADFWGKALKKYAPEFNDNKGCSLVLTNSSKGEELLKKVIGQLTIKQVPVKPALSGNPMYYKSAFKHPLRKSLMKNLQRMPFDKFIKKYGKILF